MDWLRHHPWMPAIFAAGMLAGVVFRFPLVPWELPESTANILGAALGAIFAVWGAAWVSDLKERQGHMHAANAIVSTVVPVLRQAEAIDTQLDALTHIDPTGEGRKHYVAALRHALASANLTIQAADEMAARLKFMEPLFLQLGGAGAIAHGALISTGPSLGEAFQALRWGAFYDEPNVLIIDAQSFSEKMKAITENAEKSMTLLVRFASGGLTAATKPASSW
jgi:hypothetical protein